MQTLAIKDSKQCLWNYFI